MRKTVSVLIVDDHALLRETLRARLDREPGMKVTGTAGDATEAVTKARALKPDVVLMDIDMPGRSCFSAARAIRSDLPDTCVLYLSAFHHDGYIESALRAGASGYLTKDEPPEVLIEAIRSAASGVAYFSPKVQSRIVVREDGVGLAKGGRSRASTLTARELEVLRYIARSRSKKEIAALMHVSVSTVNRHTENLMEKLDIHDRVELARFAIRERLAEA